MKILVVGSGGREHALCAAFRRSPRLTRLFCADGNAGIGEIAELVPIKPDDITGLAEFASQEKIDLTFVGGETSLALGIVDEFEKHGLTIIGPSTAAAQLEASKAFAKDLMARHNVPTATYVTGDSADAAMQELAAGTFGGPDSPVVVKADGLAAGKGVVVASNRADAETAIRGLSEAVGSAASKIVLEECLFGREISLLAFVSGEQFALMPPTRDHKRIGEGDTGPNTGGMGAIADASLLTEEQLSEIVATVVRPTLSGCVEEGLAFKGILFVGLMMTESGPKVLEYNIRFGDPETQAILVRLETDLIDICEAMTAGSLDALDIRWRPGSSACVVLASAGYPAKARTGDVIHGLDNVGNVDTFHAGTGLDASGNFVTAGGRVLGVTAAEGDLPQALKTAYSAVEKITWAGMQYRRDIGK